MRNFRHDNRSNDRRGGGKRFRDRNQERRNFDRHDSGRPSMYQAICAECGNACEVPFKPTNDRPIYCSKCFEAKDRKGGRRFGGRNGDGSGFADRDSRHPTMFRVTCAECGKSCEIPFKPRDSRPVYCDSCFENRRNDDGNFRKPERSNNKERSYNTEQFTAQFEVLNDKLDKILKMLSVTPVETVLKEEVKKEVVSQKVKAEKPKKTTKKVVAKKKKKE